MVKDEIDGTCHICGLGEKLHTKFWALIVKETDPLGAGGIGQTIIRVLK